MFEGLKFDFRNETDEGYAVLPPGRYNVRTAEWTAMVKETTGNVVLWINLTVQDGDFKGENLLYFHTLMTQGEPNKIRTNRRFFLRLLHVLGIIQDGDRGPNRELDVDIKPGSVNEETGRAKIESILVNGKAREVKDRPALAVLTANAESPTGVGVDRLEPVTGGTPTSKGSKKPNDVPF